MTPLQIHILEPGGFRTAGIANIVHVPVHPAYANPYLKPAIMRKVLPGAVLPGDSDKVTNVIYQLFTEGGSDLPLRIPLGKDAVLALRSKVAQLTTGVDKVEKYSDDLVHD
jgi:hypothetical protein